MYLAAAYFRLSLLSPSSGAALDSLVQAFHQGLIVTVRGHIGGNASSDGEAEEVEVSNQVQYLVTHEFVGITELRIDNLAFIHDDMGMEIPASDPPKLLAISIFSKVLNERAGAISIAKDSFPGLKVRTCSPMGGG